MTENEKMIFELLDEYAQALNETEINAAKSKIEKELTNMFLDKLISQGYKRDKAEAVVDFVTRDRPKDVNYSSILGKFGGNTVIDKVSGLPLKELYRGYLIYDKYHKEVETLITNGIELKKQLEENGEYDYNGKKQLVEMYDAFLNATVKSMSNQPLASNAYKTYIKYVGMEASELMNFFINRTSGFDMGYFFAFNASNLDIPLVFTNLVNNKDWKNGPTLEEMERFFNGEYGYVSEEDLKLFEPYLQWRYMYEIEQELEAGGITLEEYTEMLEALNDKPSFWEKARDFIGDLIEEVNDYWETFVEAMHKKYDCSEPIDKTDEIIENMKKISEIVGTAEKTRYDPLIFDLDGDGYNVEKKELGANFDLDKNGFAEKINWTKKDGFLCLDLNGNGAIDDGGELFGDQTLLADGTRAKNGFEALAQYDSNGDGVIDAGDEIFDSLRIWVDADGNGVSGEGEMKTLAELGITSISLGYENVNAGTDTEATIGNAAVFTREDGTTGSVGELWVSSDLFDTKDRLDIEISDEIAALPDVKSIGNVYSLHNAMALDETGELKALVESFAVEEDADKRMAIAEQILFFICGASDVEAGSRGRYIDARQLAVIEAMLGEKYVGTAGADPHSDAAPMLKSAYQDLLNMYYNELNAQTFIKDYAALLRYTENEDGSKTLNADLVNFILEYQLANGDENAEKMLTEVARYVQYLDNGGIKGINSFVMNYAAISAEYAAEIVKIMPNGYAADGENPLEGTNNGDFLVGSNNNDELYGYEGNDTLIGGKGNDRLYGGKGDDTYIFNLGDGNDVINEQNANTENDRVVFGEGISAEDIEVIRSGNDMVLKIKDTEDSLRIVAQYSDSWYWVENFEFADGTVRTVNELLETAQTVYGSGVIKDYTSGYGNRNNTLAGSDGSDELYGYEGNDILIGGKGNDSLYGGKGDDTYIFNLGDGNDVINEQNANTENDRVVFGEGISAENIIFQNISGNMVIRFVGSDDTITITNQFSDSWYRIEGFYLSDGTVIDYSKINLLIQSMSAFEADTGMSWTEAAEQPTEEYSDIISQMWVKTA